MQSRWLLAVVFAVGGTGWTLTALAAHVESDLVRKATWKQPTPDEVRLLLETFVHATSADDSVRRAADAAWTADRPSVDREFLLDRTAAVLAVVEPRAEEIRALCRSDLQGVPPAFPWLQEETVPGWIRANLRLLYGRWLAQHAHFDESLECLRGLEPQQVVDPATLLFYQAVSQHRLLLKDDCLKSLSRLMENEAELPRRYKTVAQLMEADIKPLKADSLDEISRLMEDIRRRLDFGHAGQRVRKQEDDVIAKLDKMIEDMEQQQQQQAGAGGNAGSNQPSNPASDSRDLPGKGPGDVDSKKIGSKSGWGDLPPKEREEALQQIGKDLPAHFREVIEEYFRRLAREGDR
ncbi:MAG: hypothetical protein AB7F89_12670 [Pirellulaceae bacterium]